MMSEKSVAT